MVTITGKHVVLLVVALIGCVYGAIHFLGDRESSQAEAEQPARVNVDLDAFYEEGRANEVAVQERLRGKAVEVRGVVGDVVRSMGVPEVSIVSRGGSLAAHMPASEAAALKKDQSVTLVCESLHYAGTDGSSGSDCHVTSAGKVEPGLAADMNRDRSARDTAKLVGNAVGGALKSVGGDLKAAAAALSSSGATPSMEHIPQDAIADSDVMTLALDCKPLSKDVVASIWPTFYLDGGGALCFNVKSWPGYTGSNCVANGQSAQWTGTVIVSEDGDSKGRDDTTFRVSAPVVAQDRIHYVLEWSRGAEWRPMQDVDLNRVTGEAVSRFVTSHGADSYRCSKAAKAL